MHTSNNIPRTNNQSLSINNKAIMINSHHHEQVKKNCDKLQTYLVTNN
jgi:hypothetical protein